MTRKQFFRFGLTRIAGGFADVLSAAGRAALGPAAAASRTRPAPPPPPRMPATAAIVNGIARVDVTHCYQAMGQPCDYCEKSCPVRPRAIRVGRPGDVPAIDAKTCDGCGKCAQICPANAIGIEERR